MIKYNKHGAIISIEEGVAGLVHISEFESEEKLRDTIELGKSYPFIISLFEPTEQRMTLGYGNKPLVEEKNKKTEDSELSTNSISEPAEK